MRFYANPVLYAAMVFAMIFVSVSLVLQMTKEKKYMPIMYWVIFSVITLIMDILVFDYYKTNIRALIMLILNAIMFYLICRNGIVKAIIRGAILFVLTLVTEFSAQLIFIIIGYNITDHFVEFYVLNIGLIGIAYLIARKFDLNLIDINRINI